MVIKVRGAPKFEIGSLTITPEAEAALTSIEVLRALLRHASGDWGTIDASDKQQNDIDIAAGGALKSRYTAKNGTSFTVITEANRAATSIQLT